MIKKFTFVFLLTLISQIISLISISFVVKRNATDSFIEFIALLDSSYLLINTILSFGIIQIATREIVIADKWKKVVEFTQNIRINFSYVLFLFGIICFLITNNYLFLVFLLSPLIALNVNYVFYAKGKPEVATKNSSIRVFFLSFSLIFSGLFQFFSNEMYLIFFILGLGYVAFTSNIASKVKINYKLKLTFHKEYSKSIGVGISDLSIIFLEFGVLFFATFFFNKTVIAEAYILIKIITLIKGFQRMIFQVFYNQLIDEEKTFFLDKIIFFTGFSFFIFSFFFTEETLMILFSKNNNILQNNFRIFGFALLIASIILASMARTLILKKDKIYIRSYFISLIFSFLTMIVISFTKIHYYGISITLLVGELVLFLSFFIGIMDSTLIKKYTILFLKYFFIFLFYYLFSLILITEILLLLIFISQSIIAFLFFLKNKNSIN